MLNAPSDRASTSWRLSLQRCLLRREALEAVGGIDLAFESLAVAGLELGHRLLMSGAVIEHRPELQKPARCRREPVGTEELYAFLLRSYGLRWARYVVARRGFSGHLIWKEWMSLRLAIARCAQSLPPSPSPIPTRRLAKKPPSHGTVSVIIPTLGRYPYLPAALQSMRTQTVVPLEVIVVDQNPPESRQPSVYLGYEDIGLQVIWQDERGQSLARNTALAKATGEYVFMFDDDSIAALDVIEQHLSAVADSGFDVSTGVSYPPAPEHYELPPSFRHPRLAQTLDTGNALLRTALVRQMGGLDRNYDFGPGTDTDFGTRLYLGGYRILHNPRACRVHYKAPMGGLRVHGSLKYNTDRGLMEPFPPVTQAYYGLRYLSPRQRRERALLMYVTSKLPPDLRNSGVHPARRAKAFLRMALLGIAWPFKWRRANAKAYRLLARGVRIANFGHP
ncbi:MAG: putative glycosyltransferase [Gemmatimonadetes bacterium]|nr:putative glycosyltransferase [Gemmatimonadota bacterium]